MPASDPKAPQPRLRLFVPSVGVIGESVVHAAFFTDCREHEAPDRDVSGPESRCYGNDPQRQQQGREWQPEPTHAAPTALFRLLVGLEHLAASPSTVPESFSTLPCCRTVLPVSFTTTHVILWTAAARRPRQH